MAETPPPTSPPPPEPRPDTAAMTTRELAEAVLARTIRPRVSDVRRLAQAIVGKSAKKARKAAKSGSRKLARIPGQAKKKKKK